MIVPRDISIAPEILLAIRSGNYVEYDHTVDWYSLGVVACRMLTTQVQNIDKPILTLSRPNENKPNFLTKPMSSLYRLLAIQINGQWPVSTVHLLWTYVDFYEHENYDTAQNLSMNLNIQNCNNRQTHAKLRKFSDIV